MPVNIQVNDAYLPLLNCDKRFMVLRGGAGSGKSVFLCQLALLKIMQADAEGRRLTILCTRKVGNTIQNSIFRELRNVAIDADILDRFRVTNRNPMSFKIGKSEIIFAGIDDPEKIKSVSRPDIIWMEEATEFDFEDFAQLNLRLRGEGLKQMWLSFNPIDADHWLRTKIWDSDNAEIQANTEKLVTTYKDNRFVGKEYAKEMESMQHRDYNYYKIYALAEWGTKPEGLIYPTWQKYNDENEIDDAEYQCYGLDFGYNDPMALVDVKIKGNRVWAKEMIYVQKMNMERLIRTMEDMGISKSQAMYCDTAAPEKIEMLRRAGFNAKDAVKGSVEGGIQTVKLFSLYIHEKSLNIQKELNHYSWKTDKKASSREGKTIFLNEPSDVYNHSLDALRYVIVSTQNRPSPGLYFPINNGSERQSQKLADWFP